MTNPNEPIEDLLERMRVATPEQPGSVRRDVWRRIADSEATGSRASIFERIELAFSRPAFAAAFVTVCVLGGLLLAEIRLSEQRAQQAAKIEQEYVRMVAPLFASALAEPDDASLVRTKYEP